MLLVYADKLKMLAPSGDEAVAVKHFVQHFKLPPVACQVKVGYWLLEDSTKIFVHPTGDYFDLSCCTAYDYK